MQFLKSQHSNCQKAWKEKKKQAFLSLLFVLVSAPGFEPGAT